MKNIFTDNGKLDFKSLIGLFGLIATGLSAVGVNPMAWGSWNTMFQQLLGIVNSPAMVITFFMALYGWYRNNQEETK